MFLFILEFYTFEFCVSLFLAESIFFMIKYTLGPIQDTLYLFLEKKFDFILLKIWLKRNIINFVRWQLGVAWFYSWSEVTNNFACVVNLFVTSTQTLALLPILTMAIMNIQNTGFFILLKFFIIYMSYSNYIPLLADNAYHFISW